MPNYTVVGPLMNRKHQIDLHVFSLKQFFLLSLSFFCSLLFKYTKRCINIIINFVVIET